MNKKLKEAFKLYKSVISVITVVNSSHTTQTLYCGKKLYDLLNNSTIYNKANIILDEKRNTFEYGFTSKNDLIDDVDEFFE